MKTGTKTCGKITLPRRAIDFIRERFCGGAAYPLPDGSSVLMLKTRYTPYRDPGTEYFVIDAFYPASHSAYISLRALSEILRGEGVECEGYDEPNFKEIAVRCGLAYGARLNSLAYSRDEGSRFAIGALLLPGITAAADLAFDTPNAPRSADAFGAAESSDADAFSANAFGAEGRMARCAAECARCLRCARACPTGAITEGNGFEREKCLRTHMARGAFPDAAAARGAGRRLWGCDICQRVCPRNGTAEADMPAELKEILRAENFLNLSAADMKRLGGFIGANYARRKKLFGLARQLLLALSSDGV